MAIRRQDSLGYQIGRLSRLFDRSLEDRLKNFGVLPGEFPTLVMLFEQDGLTQAELCQRIRVEQPTMANTLNRMERDGLISRIPDPRDKRRAHIHLTKKAADFRDDLMVAAREVPSKALAGLSVPEQDQAYAILVKMIDNLKC